MKTPNLKLQAIVEGPGKWPYIGNGYLNQDGSITLVLDKTVKLELPDGRVLQASEAGKIRLMARRPYRSGAQADAGE